MARVQGLLQLVTSSPGRPAGLPTLCQGPGSASASWAGPRPKSTSLLCFSFRRCIITANMPWRGAATVRQSLPELRCTWHLVLESRARDHGSSWLAQAGKTRDFQKSGVVCWHGVHGMSFISYFLDSGLRFTTKPTD